MNRRNFFKNSILTGALGYLNTLPLPSLLDSDTLRITLLHTNDVHSRVEPFPMDGSRNQGQGGIARRAALIRKIRLEEKHVLLLDAGDIFQGTPYFNLFGGEVEFKLMTEMQYDAATIGNHDFDKGIDGFVKQLPLAKFPFIISNYDFKNTNLHGRTITNKVFDFENIRLGIYGLGIELEGLVPFRLYGETVYHDPIKVANRYERFLKNEMNCDFVICLSHLGYRYKDSKVSDIVLAQNTKLTDLIIGGHTHTFMKEPVIESNLSGKPVIINQVGWAGIMLGRFDLFFGRYKNGFHMNPGNVIIA